MIVAAIPVKDLINAKQRLMAACGPAQRSALARTMLRDVLAALAAARFDRLWVVTRDPEAIALALEHGAEPLTEPDNRGHTAAVATAQAAAARIGARVFLTVPGDVPCVTADEARALAAAVRPGGVAFAPSRSRHGTNGAALSPVDAMPLTFGEPSFYRHLAAARARGLRRRVLALPGLALDVDAPDDLRAVLVAGPRTHTGRLLAAWRASGRLAGAEVSR